MKSGFETEEKKESIMREAFTKWLGLFLVIVAALVIFLIITNADSIAGIIGSYVGILKPVVYGCVIAYILNPLMKVYQGLFLGLFERNGKTASEKLQRLAAGLAIALSVVSGIVIISILCWMVFPQLVKSLTTLANNLPQQANYYYQQLTESIKNNTLLAERMQDIALNVTDYLDKKVETELLPWLQSELLPNVNSIAQGFANGVMSVLNLLYNLFIGIIVAIYILAGKNTFLAQAKKAVYGLFQKKYADTIIHYVSVTDKMFSGFISGKIVDSTIIGILCFFAMTILQMPYAMLISVIVGVTNVIPVFGPYIGLLPGTFLILLINPMQALYFVIMIAVLQQLDGNIIGPAILGESTGLSAFWVLFSILLFGGLWGIVGMIVGVPLFAVIYRVVADFINWRLHGRGLSSVTDNYRDLKYIAVEEDRVAYVKYTASEKNQEKLEKRRKREKIKEKYLNTEKWKNMLSKKTK